MRKYVLHTLLAAVLAATATTATACNKGDPNALETHVKKLDDPKTQGEGFKELERIVSGIATDPEDTRRHLTCSFAMLDNKVDSNPKKKHGNIPL